MANVTYNTKVAHFLKHPLKLLFQGKFACYSAGPSVSIFLQIWPAKKKKKRKIIMFIDSAAFICDLCDRDAELGADAAAPEGGGSASCRAPLIFNLLKHRVIIAIKIPVPCLSP